MTDTALPSPWLERERAMLSRQQLDSTISDLKTTCEQEHRVDHVAKCPSCYPKVVEAIQSLFATSEAGIYGENAKIQEEIQSVFSTMKNGDRQASEGPYTQAVLEAKKHWYRSTLSQILDLVVVEKNFTPAESLSALQRDPDNVDAIIESVWKMLGNPENWSEETQIFAGKIAAAKTDEERRALCPIRAYRDKKEKSGAVTDDTTGRDLQRSKPTKAQRTTLEERLGEISRARTAFEQTKAAKAKSRSFNGTQPVAGPGLETLPTCQTCWKPVDDKNVLSCAVCQVAVQMPQEKNQEARLTLYCSEKCYENGQPSHIDTKHQCTAGGKCSSILTTGGDASISDEDEPEPVVCKQCLQDKVLTLFCSRLCGGANLSAHQQITHEAKTSDTSTETAELLLPLEEVALQQLEEANPRVQFTWVEAS